ncbi:MAG: AmmeMemoRadiSam system radical SAM enzyme [Planctomycetes bacterium]|nr:AmmeMemoRadiSam system radical SAM enzyme [Planctomycetota bacterium]
MRVTPCDRREFLTALGRYAGGACLACGLGAGPHAAWAGQEPEWKREIDFYTQLPDRKIQCFVCPLHCVLEDGETCFCRTRTNVGGKLYTRAYDNPCILRVDAVEKLPLNHFRPASQTLTIGVGGCNLRCIYCQNWQQSQALPDQLKTYDLTVRQAVEAARKKKIDTIAFSYTEPIAFLEYARDIAELAQRRRLKVVVATAAFAEPEPLFDFAQHVDAFVVSLKGFDEEFYHRALGVKLAPVLAAIKALKEQTTCWLELINLIVPTYNDDLTKIAEMTKWIHGELGGDVPLHFSRFVPTYKLKNLSRTPVQTLEAAVAIARDTGLRYVYTSNIAPHDDTNTYCAKCGTPVIQRLGFKILENTLKRGRCPKCRAELPGVWT